MTEKALQDHMYVLQCFLVITWYSAEAVGTLIMVPYHQGGNLGIVFQHEITFFFLMKI